MTPSNNFQRILFVGDQNPNLRTPLRVKAFRDLGKEVITLDTNTHSTSRPLKTLYKISFKLGFPLDLSQINLRLREEAKKGQQFDLLWLEKPLSLKASSIKIFKSLQPHAKVVFFSEDNMFKKHNQSTFFKQYAPLLDLFLTTKSQNLNDKKRHGIKEMMFVKKTYSELLHYKEPQEKIYNVTFVGTFEEERAEHIQFLAENGVNIDVFGSGWGHLRSHNNINVHPGVYGRDYRKVINQSKIALCFLRKINDDKHTDRSVEIPAMGSLMLAERTEEHLNLFQEGVEACFFSSKAEMLDQIQYYLKNDQVREKVAQAGRNKLLSLPLEKKDSLQLILKKLDDLKKKSSS